MSPRLKQILMIVATAAIGAAIEVFSKPGPWSHAFWLPVLMALLTELRTAMGLPPAQNAPTAAEVKGRITGAVKPIGPVLVLLAVSALAPSCAHSSPPVTAFGHCTDVAAVNASENILADVTTALATGNYVAEIADLATRFGAAEVGCAVDLVISEFTQKAQRSQDTQTAVVLLHAQQWRSEHP